MERNIQQQALISNGEQNKAFLACIDDGSKNEILRQIAGHYGISGDEAREEVEDQDAESLLDYLSEPARTATLALMQRHGFH